MACCWLLAAFVVASFRSPKYVIAVIVVLTKTKTADRFREIHHVEFRAVFDKNEAPNSEI